MNVTRRPPGVATWLLKRFISGAHANALLGDLTEEHQRGRSRIWYWRQVGLAIIVSFRRVSPRQVVRFLLGVALTIAYGNPSLGESIVGAKEPEASTELAQKDRSGPEDV